VYAAARPTTEWGALALGAVLAALALVGWRVDGGARAPAATVTLVTSPAADLAVTPSGVTRERKALRPSAPRAGLERRLTVTNASATARTVRLRGRLESAELGNVAVVRVTAGGRPVFRGTLAELRRGTRAFTLASHASTDVVVRTWIPETTEGDWQARSATVELQLVSKAVA
jgi:hypothetical protein